MSVEMKREQKIIPSYPPAEPNALPFFLEKKGLSGRNGQGLSAALHGPFEQ